MQGRRRFLPAALVAVGISIALLRVGAFASDDEEAQLLRHNSIGSLLRQEAKPPAVPSPTGRVPSRAAPSPAGRTQVKGSSAPTSALRDDGKTIYLFGTLEMRTKLGKMPKWDAVLAKERAHPGYTDTRTFPGRGAWKAIREELADASVLEKAKAVNTLINKWPYRTDMDVWGVMDYWAAPVDFFQKSGDCEDFAIAKYFALRALGVPASQMRIVILKDTLRNLDHAVAVIYTEGGAWVLDNLSNSVLSHKRYSQYRPQFSINEEFRWAHLSPGASSPQAR